MLVSKRLVGVAAAAALLLAGCSSTPAADPTGIGPVPITVSPSVVAPPSTDVIPSTAPQASTGVSTKPSASTSPSSDGPTTTGSTPTASTTHPASTTPTTSGSSARSSRPPASTSSSRATAGGIPAADRTEIAKVWADYWKVRGNAGTSKAGNYKAQAASVATGIEYSGLIETDEKFRQNGIASFGEFVSRISWGPLVSDEAVIRDCMDQSKFGTYDTSNNKAITIGHPRVNLNVTFKSTTNGWRVSTIFNAKAEKC